MPRFYFEKLVRDKVLDRCLDDPKVLRTEYEKLAPIALKKALIDKIHEEAAEIPVQDELDDDVLSEIADVQAVVNALCNTYGISREQLAEAVARKEAKNGGFANGAYIDYVDLNEASEWVDIFCQQPDKYREG